MSRLEDIQNALNRCGFCAGCGIHMAFPFEGGQLSLHFWGSLACKIEKAKESPNCDAYHLRVSIFALKKCCSEAAVSRKERHTCGQALKVELHRFVGS